MDTYFHFFAYKNYNARAAAPATNGLAVEDYYSDIFLAIFAFLIVKITMQRQQLQVYQVGCIYLFSLFCM